MPVTHRPPQRLLRRRPATARLRSLFPNRALLPCLLPLVALGSFPARLAAESGMILETPGDLEAIGATTFDVEGHPVGASSFDVVTEAETGNRRLMVRMAIEGGGVNLSEATLAPIAGMLTGQGHGIERTAASEGNRSYRLLEERSQATRADGVALDWLVIDHRRRRVSCYPPNRDVTKGLHLDLPEDDRVVNVPMQLLFRPLVTGEAKAVHFQIALCRDGPVLHRMIAVPGERSRRHGRDVIEVRYGPDLGRAVSWLASRLLPRFSFWFDARDGEYLGHRMPLHRQGPEVLLVRQGLTPFDIGLD